MAVCFNATVSELQSRTAENAASQHEIALIELADECKGTSDELLVLLNNLKSTKPGSKRSSIRAAWRDLRKKDDKKMLQQKLCRCRQ